MAKELKFVMLLDCYGDLLTEHQRSVMEQYYCEDLSLQAVRSLIKRTEDILLNYEENLGFAERLGKLRSCFDRIAAAAETIESDTLKKEILTQTETGRKLL